ncbi:PBECR2 nuclease fold domain-containing protein, partial [Campylobacter upsaliensis]
VVKGAFDPIFRLLPDKILFGLFAKQIQGGALRYHLKKALSRSLNYDDFKIKLEKELKRTNFNSNTSRLIDEFMQNLEDFNREKEQFLEAKRIEQTRIKEEEQARINTIKTAQENAYNAQEANLGNDILEPSSLKEDFGENFAGYKGKEAIEKLLEEQRGQVRGAFYKEGLGEIDLVWGDENFGLRHILEQRTKQWGEEKALKFISHLNENIEKGQIVEVQKGRAAIKTDLTTIILDKKENNNFVLTAFRDRNNKKELESLNLSQSKTFTSENAEANAKESPVTSLNQESIIAQNAKNDEVLEAEVIEEVGLNEPMKFLEFQQRKLLTYIKENTPLKLLEHKKELKTRDILNFLEQSALNGKQKVFLMRNLERDLGKLEAQLKEAEEVGFKEAKNAVDDDFLKGYDEKIKQNIKSLEFENELIENPRPRGREPQDRYISLAYFMANFAQHYKLLDLKNPRTKEQIKLLENALKKQNIGYEVLENEPVAIRYFKKEWVKRQGAKQKTINKVDEYAKSEEFKALSEDKQEAILSLKNLEPSIMPSEISKDNLENILKHFNSKQDKARREFYAKLFNDTKENPHIVLEVKRENELRQEYIKAYQHKDTHDLYYIAITKDKDTINVTGYPITKIKDVINQIKNAEKVVWRQQGDQTHTALVSKETQNLESVNESIAQNAKRAEFESFKGKIKELYTKYEALNHYDKSASQLRSKLLNEEIEPEIKKEFKSIIDKFKGADNKDKILRVIKENKEELSDYLAFHIALRKDIDIDGHGEGKVDFYDKSIRDFIKLRENKRWSEIDESKYRALVALENLSNKNTSLHFSFRDLNGKIGEFKTYPRIQDLLFYDLPLGDDLKNAVILSTKDKLLKEKLIEKLKAYIDKKIYADFLEYKIKDMEDRNPSDSLISNHIDEKWDAEALKSFKKELEDLRANEIKESEKAWLEAFGLKSLEEAYIPNFKAEVKEAINRVLGGEEIKLTKGSLIKLIKEKRLKYLDRIKPTLENPHSVILQNDGALIFARDYGEEKYFTSVARNDSGEWIIRSNAPKSKNGLNNKILNGGKEIYNDQAASQINASNPYDDIANSNIKLDNESIAQNADYLELVKEYGEENAKRIIKQKILSENIAQVLENEEEKFIYKKGDREFEFKIKDAMGQFEMQYDELNLKSDLNKSFLKALNKLKIGYEVLENEPVRIRYFKQEAKERKPKETKPSANKILGQIQKDMSARLKELKAQAKENYERYKNEDKALQKELTNTKDLFKAFEKEFNETEGTILISRAKRRKNDAEGKVETSVFLGNELALRNALDRWERYSGYSEENALEVKERLELLRSYVKRLEKHREDIRAKREQLEQDYQQNEAARSKEMGVIGNYNILSNLKGVSENELYEPFLEKIHGFLSKADFYERHLPFIREEFQKLFNITPLKEFGTNYAEFYRDGKGAVEKLLAEKQGQVSGAFYKEGLGEIDLVWGDSKKGLSHILERRTQDFINQGLEKGKAEYKVRELLSEIPQILENGKILSQNNDKIELITDKYTLVLGLRDDKKFIVTELIDKRNKKRLEAMQTGVGDSFTNEPLAKTPLSQNQQEIIPQQKIKFAMEKFNYDEKKAKDLLEWHKNSHALTKDENGLPKVFYHGTYSKFRVFRRVGKASQQGFFFTPSQKATEEYG